MKFKKLEPIPAKRREEMPNSKLGITFKEWKARKPNKNKWRNKRWLYYYLLIFYFGHHLLFI